MAPRPLWKGYLQCAMVTIPIRLYPAAGEKPAITFNQLHATDHGRIRYEKKCSGCGETVAQADIVKGYEYGPDQYVVVDPDELKTLRAEGTHRIQIEGFVPVKQIEPTLFDTPYYLAPDGEVGNTGYGLLAKTLGKRGVMGVGRVVLRDREDLVLVAAYRHGLILYKLRYPQYLRSFEEVLEPGQPAAEAMLKSLDSDSCMKVVVVP